MRYICCVWLCIVWLVCHAQNRVSGLHIQKAPEIIQRITRQATRYGAGGTNAGTNYRPVAAQASNYNLRNGAIEQSSSGLNHPFSVNSGQRTSGVGAFSFGGMASGRPTNGNSFAVNTAPIGKVVNNAIKPGGSIRPQPQANPGIAVTGGKPNQLQQALVQAAQYQLQQKLAYQQQQQQQQQYQSQQPQHRRQVPQQVYRQRPSASNYEYQQFN